MSELAFVGPEVRERLVVRFGTGVHAWCDELPARVGAFAARWDLELVGAGGGGTSRVFRCRRRQDGSPAWLKVTPDPAIAAEEAEALRAWAGKPSMVTLLAQDAAEGALLLEGVEPGVPVNQLAWRLPDVAVLLRDLRASSPAPGQHSVVRPLSHRVGFLFDLTGRRVTASGGSGPFDSAMLDRARTAALELATSGPVALVHGDLHPANVLAGPGAGMVAIDPRPAWGDPDFDAVDWVIEGVVNRAELDGRIAQLSELLPGLSSDRLLGWCRALAALVAVPRVIRGRDDPETAFLMALARS